MVNVHSLFRVPRIYLVTTNQEGKRYACLFNESDIKLENNVSHLRTKGNVDVAKMVINILETSIKSGKEKVVIRTNEGHLPVYLFKFIPRWKTTDFLTSLNKPVVGAEEYKKIEQLMKNIEVRVEPFTEPQGEKDKEVMNYLEEAAKELDM